jgi:hypothetical protein
VTFWRDIREKEMRDVERVIERGNEVARLIMYVCVCICSREREREREEIYRDI